MQARYYDPVIGRYYGNDPVGFTATNIMSFNRYLYVNNNPYKYTDPDGEFATLAWAAFGMVLEFTVQSLENGGFNKNINYSKVFIAGAASAAGANYGATLNNAIKLGNAIANTTEKLATDVTVSVLSGSIETASNNIVDTV